MRELPLIEKIFKQKPACILKEMKVFKKTFGEYFAKLKVSLFAVFILSIIQCIFVLAGISSLLHFGIFNLISLIGFLELVAVFFAGFYLSMKRKFKLRQIFFAGILLFGSSILILFFNPATFPAGIPIIFQVLSYSIIILINLLLFAFITWFGGVISEVLKKFEKKKK